MATYVNDLRLKEIATGDESGTWGTSTNTNLELIAEAFSYGTEAITTNADTHTTTIADGSTDPGRSMYLKYTGTLDSACTITIGPNTVSKMWFIENGTSGSQNIIISQGSGANITIPAGDTKAVYSDGAGSGAAFFDAFASINVGALTATSLDISGDIDVDGTTNLDVVDIDGAVNFAADATFVDNVKAIFGAGSDLQIYHDGSNSYIDDVTGSGTGDLFIKGSDAVRILTPSLVVNNAANNENMITAAQDGAATLYHNGSPKIATTATGIDVTGTVTSDGLTVNSSEVLFDNTGGDFTLKLNTNAVGDKNEIIMGDSATPLAKFGVGGAANDIITGSDGQDFNIGTAGGGRAINFSTDNFGSVEMKFDGGSLGIGTAPSNPLQIMGGTSGVDQIHISSNLTDNTIKYAGIITTMYTNNTAALLGAKAENGNTNLFFGSSGTDHRGVTKHKFFTNSNYNATSGNTLRVQIDSDGLKFNGDTAAANALDDYEEGTFTPTFSGASLSTATGSYTKIGNQVTAYFHVVTTGGLPSSGGQVQVGALPFTSGSGFIGAGSLYVGPSNVSSATGGGGAIVFIMEGSATVVRFVNIDTGTLGYTIWGELEVSANNVVTAIGTVTYTV